METQTFGLFGQGLNLFFGFWGLVIIAVIYFIATYNSIINLKNTVKETFSSIDTVLQNRYNLIPNLVEVVKQYMQHESGVISKVTELRASLMSNSNKGSLERFAQENELQAGLKSIFAVAENYPDLKASANFLELQTSWSEIEDRLQGARRAYNASIKELNNKKEMFPSNIVASMMTIEDYKMFEADSSARVEKLDAKAMFS
ncbi:LemA family protein [Candidatus Gracilibacteria bacterium]|nr:LemA family protein [Candidatus Gracilibacteria bacterium]